MPKPYDPESARATQERLNYAAESVRETLPHARRMCASPFAPITTAEYHLRSIIGDIGAMATNGASMAELAAALGDAASLARSIHVRSIVEAQAFRVE